MVLFVFFISANFGLWITMVVLLLVDLCAWDYHFNDLFFCIFYRDIRMSDGFLMVCVCVFDVVIF